MNSVGDITGQRAKFLKQKNDSVRTAKKTQHFTITKISWLTLFKEIITVYYENQTKPINIFYGQNVELLNVKVGGTTDYTNILVLVLVLCFKQSKVVVLKLVCYAKLTNG
jgi:hypothetical protein